MKEQNAEERDFKSDFGKNYSSEGAYGIDINPEEEAVILGEKKSVKTQYNNTLSELDTFDERIKNMGLEGKSPLAIFVYELLDKTGLYSKERLLDKEIDKLDVLAENLEKQIDTYTTSVKNAHEQARTSDTTKYKAHALKTRYKGIAETLELERDNLIGDCQDINKQIEKETDQELTDKLVAMKLEINNINYDLSNMNRKVRKASSAIIKSHGKSSVYRMHERIRDKVLTAMEMKYHEVDILREQWSDLRNLSKDEGLKGAISLLASSHAQQQKIKQAAVQSGKAMKELYFTLDGIEREISSTPLINTDDLDEVDKGTNNAIDDLSEKIMYDDFHSVA